jgi:nuclear pore complex protein Nup160
VPPVFHNSLARGSAIPAPNRSVPILEEDIYSQTLIRVIPPVGGPKLSPLGERDDAGVRVLVYMPSSAGGYFCAFILSGKNVTGARTLGFYGHKLASESSGGRARTLRDFLIIEGEEDSEETLWALWEDEGENMVEWTPLDFEGEDSDDEEGRSVSTSSWTSFAPAFYMDSTPLYLQSPINTHLPSSSSPSYFTPSAALMTQQKSSLAGAYISYLLRPGNFSRHTLRAALDQYVIALFSSSPDVTSSRSRYAQTNPRSRRQLLDRDAEPDIESLPLAEAILSVVGSTVTLHNDPQTGELLWTRYWAALRRDWDGFVARCRDIERRARAPVKLGIAFGCPDSPYQTIPLGIRFDKSVVVIERERIGALMKTDGAMQVYERDMLGFTSPSPVAYSRRSRTGTIATRTTDESDTRNEDSIISFAKTLRLSINPLARGKLDASLLSYSRQNVTSSYFDLSADISKREIVSGISEEVAIYLDEGLTKFADSSVAASGHARRDLEDEALNILDVVVGLDRVKLEEEDDEDLDLNGSDHPRIRGPGADRAHVTRPQLDWHLGLVTSYLATSLHARYELTLAILTLLCYVADAHPHLIPSEGGGMILGEAFGALQCISILHEIARRGAGDIERRELLPNPSDTYAVLKSDGSKDDVAALFRGMRVSSHSDGPNEGPKQLSNGVSDEDGIVATRVSTYSLLHLLISKSLPSLSIPILSLSQSLQILPSPSIIAHQYLSLSGFFHLGLRGRDLIEPDNEAPGVAEARLLHSLWIAGQFEAVQDLAQWFNRTPAIAYVLGRALLDSGRAENAVKHLESVESILGALVLQLSLVRRGGSTLRQTKIIHPCRPSSIPT